MSRVADGNHYEDVFVLGDLVYAMQGWLGVVHVYRNRYKSLIKLHDIRYPCGCNGGFLSHSMIVTNEHIIQCCSGRKPVYILNRSGELLRTIPIADISKHYSILCQADVDGNFLIADRWTNRLVIAHVDQPSSLWHVVNLPEFSDGVGCWGAVWFRNRLYAAGLDGRLLTFTLVNAQSS